MATQQTAATNIVSNCNVPVPIIDLNKKAYSYTHLQVDRPYIALNSETSETPKTENMQKYWL